jgi:hypothetical protein
LPPTVPSGARILPIENFDLLLIEHNGYRHLPSIWLGLPNLMLSCAQYTYPRREQSNEHIEQHSNPQGCLLAPVHLFTLSLRSWASPSSLVMPGITAQASQHTERRPKCPITNLAILPEKQAAPIWMRLVTVQPMRVLVGSTGSQDRPSSALT